jgi:hypothetical protein
VLRRSVWIGHCTDFGITVQIPEPRNGGHELTSYPEAPFRADGNDSDTTVALGNDEPPMTKKHHSVSEKMTPHLQLM